MEFLELETSAVKAAKRLLGSVLERQVEGRTIRCRIVETEAYDETDAASHSYKGRTARNDVMFGPAGYLYVYFTYGMHYCANVVVGPSGMGAAVLIRAVEPLGGVDDEMFLGIRRNGKVGVELTNGPAKLCQALDIDKVLNGHNLSAAPLRLVLEPPVTARLIVAAPRIGIREARDVPWRFYLTDNPYVSVK